MDVRFAFCFPDTYEVGMSFLGEKILYELLNSHENWWCERAFMPWLDMKAEMERLWSARSTPWRARIRSPLLMQWLHPAVRAFLYQYSGYAGSGGHPVLFQGSR